MPTTQEYHNDPSLWGEKQWMSLKEVVDEYIGGLVDGDVTASIRRTTIVKTAKKVIRRLTQSTLKEYKDVELDLSPTLQVTLPKDYVDYGSIYWVDEIGNLYPLAQNHKLSVAKGILQDNNYEYIYDHNGELILVQGRKPEFDKFKDIPVGQSTDLGQVFANGGFNIDRENGYIQFDSNAQEKTIVLSYVGDGIRDVDDADIKVSILAADAINDRIYELLIERNIKIPQSEKARARKAANISERRLNDMLNPVREEDFLQVNKSKSRQVKHP